VLVFWCWCSGSGVLVLVFWFWCSGAGVLVLVMVFWCWFWCSGSGSGVLVLVLVFWFWCSGAGVLLLVMSHQQRAPPSPHLTRQGKVIHFLHNTQAAAGPATDQARNSSTWLLLLLL
jgi:hypothetical protein